MGCETETQRHSIKLPVFLLYTFELNGGNGRGGNSVFQLQRAATSGDRRNAARSPCNAEYDRIAFLSDLFPEICCVVSENKPGLSLQDRFYGRHVFFKPFLELLHKKITATEALVYEIKSLAIQAVQSRRH
jgi:hypothetical protein